jgi:isocitrate dehydrogenase kinase/phosphatase
MTTHPAPLAESEIQKRFAEAILHGFDSYFAEFQSITRAVRLRFENADWMGIRHTSNQRIDLYKARTREVYQAVEKLAGRQLHDLECWREAKNIFAELIAGRSNFELAETFFNSVYCAVFKHHKIRDQYVFVFSPHGDMPAEDKSNKVYRTYLLDRPLSEMLEELLRDYAFSIPYEDLDRDVANIREAILKNLAPHFDLNEDDTRFQILEHHFFRNKGAYIVGRIVAGGRTMPIVLPILHNEAGGVYVDTILFGSDMVSVLFSFTRSYFLVDAAVPAQWVLFLQQLMPAKPISEIYSSMGHNKHGKTYYYRCAYRHMQRTSDQFNIAPGIKGMVMTVFTLPSYDFVFKVIKDRFTPPKDMTREQVKAKYTLVKRWDRAGRMADTQEFNNLAFARERFSDELMDELRKVAPSVVEEHGKALVIKHVYVERRMTPLNLYLRNATDEQVEAVMDEYGNAIKQLAAANIFPGDMLLKNFGVTRHGRVVFYDYDEIVPLTDCNFRTIPKPRTEAEEMSSKPWYTVGPNDIFPEEFSLFFSGNQRAREVFDTLHSDIYEASFWQDLQKKIHAGYLEEFFPYRRELRFDRTRKPATERA